MCTRSGDEVTYVDVYSEEFNSIVLNMIEKGKSKKEIVDYVTNEYKYVAESIIKKRVDEIFRGREKR